MTNGKPRHRSDRMDLAAYIRDVPDFPIPGILFRDITPLLAAPDAFKHVVDIFAAHCRRANIDAVVGIESRGFIFGTPLAYILGVPFVPVRKAGKLPAARMSVEYALEYGNAQLDIHQDALERGQRVVIVDDLLATGGTAAATAKLVELVGGSVQEFLFLIELSVLNGRDKLEGYPVTALIRY
jgi:adenine phosphoribosyltransferase